jgi:5-(carboxyamino)imidazole ribonucleotide mutase|tara:strand:- start:3464 stop:4027 length:564 start_codon:yes stop_codon:yes gene_type:complete
MKKVLILMDSDSSRHVAERAIEVLERYSIAYQLETVLAQKQMIQIREFVKESEADVIICVAGLSGALPGIVAGLTHKPVIGVPVSEKMNGLDALLGMSQTPAGVPVATVGIDNGKNGAALAMRILIAKYPDILSNSQPAESSSYSEPDSEPSTPSVMPDFMMSTTPDDPVTFDEPAAKKKRKSDWWM